MIPKRLVQIAACCLTLSACVSNEDPSGEDYHTRALNNAREHVRNAFGPLAGICVEFVETGKIARGKLQQRGYSESKFFGKPLFSKKIGPRSYQKARAFFNQKNRHCTLSSFAVVRTTTPVYEFAGEKMNALGYEYKADPALRRTDILYVRGNRGIVVSGAAVPGAESNMNLVFRPYTR